MDSFIRSLRNCLSTPESIQRILEQRSINKVPKFNVKVIGLLKEVLLLTNKNKDNFWPLMLVLKIIEEGLIHTYNSEDWSKINESFGDLISNYFRTISMYEHHFLATHKEFNTFLRKVGQCFLTLIETNESLRIIVLNEAFGVILNVIFANSFDFLVRKEVFLQLKTILKRADAGLRKNILNTYDKSLTKLAEWFPECGDYETEEVAVEILMRLSFMSKKKTNVVKHWFRNLPSIIPAVDVLNYKSFDMSCRDFLNIVNITVDTEIKVFTLPCVDAFANDIPLHKPKSEQYKKLWVDFSMRTGIIQTICDGGDNAWLSLVIEQPNVKAIICKSKSHRYQNTDFDCKDIVIELVTPLLVNLYSEERHILSVTLIFLETSKFDRLQECFFMNCYKDLYSVERGQSFDLLSKAFLNRGKHKQKQTKPTIYSSTPKSGHRISSFSKLGDKRFPDDVRSTLTGSTSISRISPCHEQERNTVEGSESYVQFVQSKNPSFGGKSSCVKIQIADGTFEENDRKFAEKIEQITKDFFKETKFLAESTQSLVSNQKHINNTVGIEGNLQDKSKSSVYQDIASKGDDCQRAEKKQEGKKIPIISNTFTKRKEKESMYQKCNDKNINFQTSKELDTSLNSDENSPFVMLIDPKVKPKKSNEENGEATRGANFNQYRVYEDMPSDKSASSSSSRPSLRYSSKSKKKRFLNEEVNAKENQQEIVSKPFDKTKSGPLINRSNGQSSIHLPNSKNEVSSYNSECASFTGQNVPVVVENASYERASNITLISLHSGGREEIQIPRGSHNKSEGKNKTAEKMGDASYGTALAIKDDRPVNVSSEKNEKQDWETNRNEGRNESIDSTDSDVPLALRLKNVAKKIGSKSKVNATTKPKCKRKSLKVNRNKTTPQKLEEQLKRLSSKSISSNEKKPSTSNKLEDGHKKLSSERDSVNDSGSILVTLKPSKTYARKNKTGGPATFRRTPEILFDNLVKQTNCNGMSKNEDNESIKSLGKKRKLFNPNVSFEEIIIIDSDTTSPLEKLPKISSLPEKRPIRSTSPDKRPKRSTSPDKRPKRSTSPDKRPKRSTSPDKRPIRSTSTEKRPIRSTSPDKRPKRSISPDKRPKISISPEKHPTRNSTHPMSNHSNKVAWKKCFPSQDADVAESNIQVIHNKNSKKNRHTIFYVSTSSSDESRDLTEITPRNSTRSLRTLPKKNYKECSSDETQSYSRGKSVERMEAIHEELGAQTDKSRVMREQDGRSDVIREGRERELEGSPASFEERRPSELDKLILEEEPTMGALEEHRDSIPPLPVPPVSSPEGADPVPLGEKVFHLADERKSLEKFVEQLSKAPLSENKENILNQVAALKKCLLNLEKETSAMGQEITMRYFEVQKCLESIMGSYNKFASFFGNESKEMNLKLKKLVNDL